MCMCVYIYIYTHRIQMMINRSIDVPHLGKTLAPPGRTH